ncbi:uncharacterized protein LOC113157204 isoform X2 [Anabas testudineus]|uniref:uncharacterized protein LOC113157204 isoform X2 n=1 Tax=Anabas testudineus TaxID=64144 RepID=UPI000E46296C|nr:uncharacterized protein LOC113157204 isoform X2 [Anabas testudineus]
MAFVFLLGVALFISVWASAKCDGVPQGVELMECRDRFFVIAVDLSCIGSEPHFEAVDDTGVYPITKQYAAECGYSVNALTVLGHMELRASYFSCHAENKDDKMFTFNFNLVATHDGEEVRYALNKTCSPSLPWSPREVTCEINYMEVSVRSDVACPTGAKRDWDAVVQTAHFSATSDWQVMFQKPEQEPVPMSLSETHRRGYVFQLTDGRLVFRTPYGQPDSFITVVDGIPVEVVHATLFSRQSWVVLLVNMEAACSMHEGSFDESTHMRWQAPEVLNPLVSDLHNTQVNIGVNGKLVEQSVAEERGYIVEKHNNTIQISIPYTAEEGYRKSFVIEDLYQFYIFNLYLEKISVDEDLVETRFRYYRTLSTPLMLCPIFTVNRMDLEQRLFIVYLGDVPEDVELVAIHFNGHEFTVPLNNTSIHMITNIHSNNTHGYTLEVPFDDPVIIHEILREESVMKHKLDIYYTLTILPENEHFNYLASVTALTYVSSPVFDAVCSESGISFKLDHQPFHYLWKISIGSDLLTSELAAQHGYIMSNSSQSLLLHVPLFTHGYQYKNVTLKEYFGTFEILLRDHETSEIQSSTVKTCPFNTTTELIG